MAEIIKMLADDKQTQQFPQSVAAAIFTDKDKKTSLLSVIESIPFVNTEEDGFYICDSSGNYVFSVIDGKLNALSLDNTLLSAILEYMKVNYLNNALENISDVGEGQNINDLESTTNTDNLFIEVYDEATLLNKKVNLKTFIQSLL